MHRQYHVLTLMNETVDLTKSLPWQACEVTSPEAAGMTIKSILLRVIAVFVYVITKFLSIK